ncbi:hypothetical protein [Salinarimonas rosea]|uniref:hypothetical protein n=1 Tax=Salinarimonas rosea TaxID=552063 RepID=UPI0003FA0B5D|nr:hypothetical protein [Salinarimonas rosea]
MLKGLLKARRIAAAAKAAEEREDAMDENEAEDAPVDEPASKKGKKAKRAEEPETAEDETAEGDEPEANEDETAEDEDYAEGDEPAAEDEEAEDEDEIAEEETTPASKKAARRGAIRERKRIAKILFSPQAQGREGLAATFAFETRMSSKVALRTLAASPAPKASRKAEAFRQAMDNTAKNPRVGGGGKPAASEGDGIIAALKAMNRA